MLRQLKRTEQPSRPQPPRREEELLLQSHSGYYLPTKGSVCTAGREPEDRDSPGDLHRTCSRQAGALISPDRCACGRASTWPARRELPGCSPQAFSRYQLQISSAAPGPSGISLLPAHVKLSGLGKETKAMLLPAPSCWEVPVPSLVLEFGSLPAQQRFPGPAWQPELSKESAWNSWGWRLR